MLEVEWTCECYDHGNVWQITMFFICIFHKWCYHWFLLSLPLAICLVIILMGNWKCVEYMTQTHSIFIDVILFVISLGLDMRTMLLSMLILHQLTLLYLVMRMFFFGSSWSHHIYSWSFCFCFNFMWSCLFLLAMKLAILFLRFKILLLLVFLMLQFKWRQWCF